MSHPRREAVTCTPSLAILAVLLSFSLGWDLRPAFGQVRVDTYDKNSNRIGYSIVDPKTGRIDFFDKYSNRTGSGQITAPPPQPPPAPSYQWPPAQPCPRPPCR